MNTSEMLPTVTIETANGPVRINSSDFDPNVHKLHDPDAVTTNHTKEVDGTDTGKAKGKSTKQAVIPAAPVAPAVPVPPVPPIAPAAPMLVMKNGAGRIIVVNSDATPVVADGIDPNGYDDETAAWAAVAAVAHARPQNS